MRVYLYRGQTRTNANSRGNEFIPVKPLLNYTYRTSIMNPIQPFEDNPLTPLKARQDFNPIGVLFPWLNQTEPGFVLLIDNHDPRQLASGYDG